MLNILWRAYPSLSKPGPGLDCNSLPGCAPHEVRQAFTWMSHSRSPSSWLLLFSPASSLLSTALDASFWSCLAPNHNDHEGNPIDQGYCQADIRVVTPADSTPFAAILPLATVFVIHTTTDLWLIISISLELTIFKLGHCFLSSAACWTVSDRRQSVARDLRPISLPT